MFETDNKLLVRLIIVCMRCHCNLQEVVYGTSVVAIGIREVGQTQPQTPAAVVARITKNVQALVLDDI